MHELQVKTYQGLGKIGFLILQGDEMAQQSLSFVQARAAATARTSRRGTAPNEKQSKAHGTACTACL